MKRRILSLSFYLGVASSLVLGQLPQTISYQGLLTTSGGYPVSDGAYTLTFRLYTSASGGSPIWTEAHTGVQVSKGTFGVILGSVTPLGGVNLNQQLYLGVTRGSDSEFTPRSMLTSAPSSLAPWAINGSNISYIGGKVGIGTPAPNEQLEITGNLRLPPSTDSTGIVYSGTDPFIFSYWYDNFSAGRNAGNLTMSGNFNTAVGDDALSNNASGQGNTAIGPQALWSNTTGNYNTAFGVDALSSNKTNNDNTAIGVGALSITTASDYNTAVGANAGANYDNGYNNVFVGANVDVNGAGYYNVIAIGQGTTVTGSSVARFGNSATASYGGWANWSNVSDGRFKKNVRENVPGLEFITRLRPITYTLDATGMDAFLHKNDKHTTAAVADEVHQRALKEKEEIVYTGFVAQEVDAAAREVGYDFSGVDAPKNKDDFYSLRYAEFVVPLVKAVQEQQKMIDELRKEIQTLRAQR